MVYLIEIDLFPFKTLNQLVRVLRNVFCFINKLISVIKPVSLNSGAAFLKGKGNERSSFLKAERLMSSN